MTELKAKIKPSFKSLKNILFLIRLFGKAKIRKPWSATTQKLKK
jgi:hypothetical protein